MKITLKCKCKSALDRIEASLGRIEVNLQRMERTMSTGLDDLTAAVAGVKEALDNEQDEIATVIELLTAPDPDVSAAVTALNEISGRIGDNTAALSGAFTPPAE